MPHVLHVILPKLSGMPGSGRHVTKANYPTSGTLCHDDLALAEWVLHGSNERKQEIHEYSKC